MASNTCFLSKTETVTSYYDQRTYERQTALCGRETSGNWRITDKPEKVDCPKCSAKLAKGVLSSKPHLRLGDAVREPSWLRSYDLRSAYPAYVHGKLLGFVGIKAGWGQAWRVYRVDYDGSIGGPLGSSYGNGDRFNSKGAALLAVETYVAEGRLYAKEDAEEARKLQLEADRKKREEEERQRLEAKAASDREAEALASIALLDLSAAQMDALRKDYDARMQALEARLRRAARQQDQGQQPCPKAHQFTRNGRNCVLMRS